MKTNEKTNINNYWLQLLLLVAVVVFVFLALPLHASAAPIEGTGGAPPASEVDSPIDCGDDGVQLGVSINDDDDCIGEGDTNPIFEYLGAIVRFLSVGVGVVVTAMIVVGGIQYSTAGGNPQSVEAAKSRIYNAIIALVLYIFMVGILNFLVPGGVL